MATNVTAAQIDEAIQTTQRAKDKWNAFRVKAQAHFEETTKTMLGIFETGIAAYGVGVVRGAYGEIKILNVPYEILLSTALHLTAFGGIYGQQKAHVHNVANGVLGGFLGMLGVAHGANLKKGQSSGAIELIGARVADQKFYQNQSGQTTHALGYNPGRPMSKEELDALSVGDMAFVNN